MVALAFDGDALLAAGSDLLRSDDGGSSWTGLPVPAAVLALATHPERPGRIIAGLASGGVALSEDGGRSWESRSRGLSEGEVDAVAIAAGQPDVIYAAVRGDGLWKSEDAGQSWSLAMDRPWLNEIERDLLALASVDLATGMGGIWIYAGTDTGLSRVPDCFCRWQDVQPGDAMDALVSGHAPPSEAPLPAGEPIHALASAPSAPGTLYAALPSGVWTSRDGGIVWSHLAGGFAVAVAVHPVDPDHIVAALDGGLKQSRDGGATWSALAAI
jgi:photosystem II stability/assembly factor-like uncharacterized protein|tara:strand:- start:33639 stop:34451 length:813 start_codon:yes stop_codon:yes gene_type:complete